MVRQSLVFFGVGWLFWLLPTSSAFSEASLLGELHESLVTNEPRSGYFLQCTKQQSSIVISNGRYVLVPKDRLEFNFLHPKTYTAIYYSDGSYVRRNGLGEGKPRFSSLGNLIFAMIRMDKPALEKRFSVDASGTTKQFSITMTPKKRIKKLLKNVLIKGENEVIRAIEITGADGREMKLMFGSDSDLDMLDCGW